MITPAVVSKKVAKKESEVQPWSRCAKREQGDETPEAIYLAVGHALSNWNLFELQIAMLFGVFVDARGGLQVAARSFGAVNTTSGKLEMLSAAAEVFFATATPATLSRIPEMEAELRKSVNKVWKGFSERRNDIAHGAVLPYGAALGPKGMMHRYYLVPSHVDAKKWRLRSQPEFAYTASDIITYADAFLALQLPVSRMMATLAGIKVSAR